MSCIVNDRVYVTPGLEEQLEVVVNTSNEVESP